MLKVTGMFTVPFVVLCPRICFYFQSNWDYKAGVLFVRKNVLLSNNGQFDHFTQFWGQFRIYLAQSTAGSGRVPSVVMRPILFFKFFIQSHQAGVFTLNCHN